VTRRLPTSPARKASRDTSSKGIYDIAEHDESSGAAPIARIGGEGGAGPDAPFPHSRSTPRLPVEKPPRGAAKLAAGRSKSFLFNGRADASPSTPTRSSFFHRSLSQLPKALGGGHSHSLDRTAVRKSRSSDQVVDARGRASCRVHVEGPSLRQAKKLFSPPSEVTVEHIYEEIPAQRRPLPPLPPPQTENLATIVAVGGADSRASSRSSTPVKSIFEGATKYDILHYLEDAKERGFTDVDDIEEDLPTDDEEEEGDLAAAIPRVSAGNDKTKSTSATLTRLTKPAIPSVKQQRQAARTRASRVSNVSSSSGGSSGSSEVVTFANKWASAGAAGEIERNDSGLGSETGGKRGGKAAMGLSVAPQPARRRRRQQMAAALSAGLCVDCDQPLSSEKCG